MKEIKYKIVIYPYKNKYVLNFIPFVGSMYRHQAITCDTLEEVKNHITENTFIKKINYEKVGDKPRPAKNPKNKKEKR